MASPGYKVHEVGLAAPLSAPTRYPLSDTDLAVATIHMKIDLFYALDPATPPAAVLHTLKRSLAAALTQIPTFASRITQDEPSARKYLLVTPESTVQLGERYLTAPSFTALRQGHFSPADLDHDLLLPPDLQTHALYPGDRKPDAAAAAGVPALYTQANFVPGGMILAVAFNHTQADAWTMHRFFALWAEHARRGDAEYAPLEFDVDFDRAPYGAAMELTPGDPENDARWLEWGMPTLAGKSEPEIKALFEASVKPAQVTGMLMHVPHERAVALKERAAPAPPDFISTYDALCALLWRALLRARIATGRFSADQDTMLRQPANVRGRSADAKPSYIGNAPGPAASGKVPAASVLGSDGLRFAAQASRRGISRASSADIRTYTDFVRVLQGERLGMLRFAFTCSAITVTSWQQMAAFKEYDFGFGFPAAFRSPGAPMDGAVIVFPSPPGEGITFWIGAHEENVEAMLKDKELAEYAVVKRVSKLFP